MTEEIKQEIANIFASFDKVCKAKTSELAELEQQLRTIKEEIASQKAVLSMISYDVPKDIRGEIIGHMLQKSPEKTPNLYLTLTQQDTTSKYYMMSLHVQCPPLSQMYKIFVDITKKQLCKSIEIIIDRINNQNYPIYMISLQIEKDGIYKQNYKVHGLRCKIHITAEQIKQKIAQILNFLEENDNDNYVTITNENTISYQQHPLHTENIKLVALF